MRTLLKNARIVSPDFDLENASLLIEGKYISGIYPVNKKAPSADKIIECSGRVLMPGFIDIHCHGCNGADFCDGIIEALNTIGQAKFTEGVTGFLATTLTVSQKQLEESFAAASEYYKNPFGAKLLGIHLEGPFINPECAGAQNSEFMKLPDIKFVEHLNHICPIRIVSFSPELTGGIEFVKALSEREIIPSSAHTMADYDLFLQARKAGMKHLTHFCNVMSPLHHLNFGMVGGGLRFSDILVEVIADGVHLCPEMLDLIFRIKGSDGIMLITDAMRASGMPDGYYDLGGLKVQVINGKATLADGTVAGSTLQFHKALQNVYQITNLPLKELVKTTSWNQASSLGLKNYGKLEEGFYADIVVLDRNLNPEWTICNGNISWKKY
jgi:N-acetylglucosamine-6-phosphate deacetylase